MGSSSAPKTPDYTSTALAQAAADKQMAQYTTQANRVDQIDPYGSTTWSHPAVSAAQQAQVDDANNTLKYYQDLKAKTGWGGQIDKIIADAQDKLSANDNSNNWIQTTKLNAQQQGLLDQQVGIQGTQNTRIADLLKNFQTPTLTQHALAATPELKQASQNNIADLLYSQATHNLDTRFNQDEAATRASLANQGFQMGSEGYQNTLNDFNTNKNDVYGQAQTAASLGGYQQMNAENAQNLQNYNAIRGGNLNDYMGQNSTDLNSYNSQMGFLSQLLGGVQGPTNPTYPGFAPATGSQSADLTGAQQATYQGNLNQTNAQNASKSQTLGTIGTIASVAAIAF